MMNTAMVSRVRAAGRLAINKLQIVQEKEAAIAKQNRRQLSQTMASGKVASARIRAETVIASDIYVELLELIELYCELIVSRAGILDPNLDRDARLAEAVHTVLYATPSTGVKELHSLRDLLLHVVTKEVALDASTNRSELVPLQVVKRVKTEVPSEELVNLYLAEIAKAYQVNVPGIYELADEPVLTVAPVAPTSTDKPANTTPGNGTEQSSEKPAGKPPTQTDDLWERFNNLKK